MAAANISLVPYTTRITTSWDERGFMTIPHTEAGCWNNQEAIKDWIEINIRKCQGIRQHGVFVYGLGDEGASPGSCVHPLCIDQARNNLFDLRQNPGLVGIRCRVALRAIPFSNGLFRDFSPVMNRE